MKRNVILLLFTGFAYLAHSQDLKPITDTLYSNILKETREFEVHLPQNYKEGSGKKFDVIYVLDGEDIASLVETVRNIAGKNELMPPFLIVGLHNRWLSQYQLNSRERDFLPVMDEDFPISGGSDDFLAFFKNELIPYINSKYPSNGRNTLFGHSYGGLLTVYAAIAHPEIFESYIASDPSIWWHDGYLNKIAARKFDQYPSAKRSLYIGGRAGHVLTGFGIATMDSILQKHAPAQLSWRVEANEDEHHGSVRLKNIYDGLKFTYFGYAPFILDFYPAGGIVLKNKPVKINMYSTYLDYNPGIRYTTDGSIPTPSSPRFDDGLLVNGGTELTLKLFSTRDSDRAVTGRFTLGAELIPAVLPKNLIAGGMNYSIYPGDWRQFPDLKKLKPSFEGQANKDFDLKKFGKQPFACQLDGFLEIKQDGYYTFLFDATEDAQLFLDKQLLVDPKAMAWNTEAKSFVVPLKKGFYPIKINYIHHGSEPVFVFMYMKPNDSELAVNPLVVPLSVLFGDRASQ